MRIGGFWGMTAPMFVFACEKKEDALPLFSDLVQTSNTDVLLELQQELLHLKKLNRLVQWDSKVCVSNELEDDEWITGKLVNHPEMSAALVTEITQKVKAMCLNQNAKGKYRDCSNLDTCISEYLASNSFKVNRIKKVVRDIYKNLSESATECSMNLEGVKNSVPDTIMVDDVRYTLTPSQKKAIEYFVSRMDDIDFWIERTSVTEEEETAVFGIPFLVLTRRKPASIRYAVVNILERVKYNADPNVLLEVIASLKKDLDSAFEMMKSKVAIYGQQELGDTNKESPVDGLLQDLNLSKEVWSSWSVLEQRIINTAYPLVKKASPERIKTAFDVEGNLTEFGKDLCKFGICGLNDLQMILFSEAINNVLISSDKIYLQQETIEEINSILTNEIQALIDTTLPIGEVI